MKKIFQLRLLVLVMTLCMSVGAFADEYTYTFESKGDCGYASGSTWTLDGRAWTLTHNSTVTNLYYDATKGIQIGTGSYPATSISLSTSMGSYLISSIKVNTSGAKSIAGTFSASIGGTQIGDTYTMTATATDVTLTNSANKTGDLTLSWTQTTSKAIYLKSITITYSDASGNSATAPSLTSSCEYSTASKEVTITNNESGAKVYYTTNGNNPTTSSSSFTGTSKTITVTGTTTVKAMAVISGKSNSSVTTATYTYLPSYANIAAFKAGLASGSRGVLTLTDAVVTFVYGSDHYVQDATGGIDLYGYTCNVGDVLNGTVTGNYKLYNGTPEIDTGATYNVTKTTGGSVTPTVVSIADLLGSNKANYACMKIKLNNVSYSSGLLVDEDENAITLYDKSKILTDYAWADKVNFVGVFCDYYTSSVTTPEVFAISTEEIEIVAGKPSPVNTWNLNIYRGATSVFPTFSTASDGVKTYESSNTAVATVSTAGAVSVVDLGSTTISCSVAESSTYKAVPDLSYVLRVDIAGEKDTVTFTNNTLNDGWTKSNGSYITTAGRYHDASPGFGMSGGTTAVSLYSGLYYNVQKISFWATCTSAADGKELNILYSKDGGETYNPLTNVAIAAGDMQEYTLGSDVLSTISSLGDVKLQFLSSVNSFYIDDIVITYEKAPVVSAPTFSRSGGIVMEPFQLTINQSNNVGGTCEIYYTLDGTSPTYDTALTYTSPITISESTTVKAVVRHTSTAGAVHFGDVAEVKYLFSTNDGTFEHPFTVDEAIMCLNAVTDTCWVTGVIVNGYGTTKTDTYPLGISDNAVVSNIVLTADGTASEQNIAVKLPVSNIRTHVNISENAGNIGKTVKVCGKIGSYYSRAGILETYKVTYDDRAYTNIWGDANADMKRTAEDITVLKNVLVSGVDTTYGQANVTGTTDITICDLVKLIDYLLPKE